MVAAHLPAGGPFALRDYGVLGRSGPAWWITVLSALPGIAVMPLLPAAFLLHTSGVRVLTSLAVGLLVAAAVSGRRTAGGPVPAV